MKSFWIPALCAVLLASCGSGVREHAASIQAKPTITEGSLVNSLRASEGDIQLFELWPKERERLDPRKTYRFDFLRVSQASPLPSGDGAASHWNTELVRVSDAGRVVYDAGFCPVHRQQMTRQTVPISYGLPLYPKGYLKARHARFPHANTSLEGGCSVGPQKEGRAFVCEKCLGEERAWKEANR